MVAIVGIVGLGGSALLVKHRTREADLFLQKGYPALAVESVDSVRQLLTRSETGCRSLLSAYYAGRKVERLDWAAQACAYRGFETPETYIAIAAVREWGGNDGDAIQVLSSGRQKFAKSADLPFRMGQILVRNKKVAEAKELFLSARTIAPENQNLQLEILKFLIGQEDWKNAKASADALKAANVENPELKLLLARVLQKNGDLTGSITMFEQAKTLLERLPAASRKALETRYSDVIQAIARLNGGASGAKK